MIFAASGSFLEIGSWSSKSTSDLYLSFLRPKVSSPSQGNVAHFVFCSQSHPDHEQNADKAHLHLTFLVQKSPQSERGPRAVSGAQLDKLSKIALACPVELSLDLLVMDPEDIGLFTERVLRPGA